MEKQCKVLISGKVQGVYFRESTKKVAIQLGVKGYVKNLRNGGVEGVFRATESQVEELLDWCKEGPPSARVDDIEIEWQNIDKELTSFEVRWD